MITFPLKYDDNHIYKEYINFLMVLVNNMYDDYIHFNFIFLGSSFIKFDSITQIKTYENSSVIYYLNQKR